MTNSFDLTGRTALVTGASRGIGLAMAVALAEAGADIVGASASLATSGSAVQEAVERHGRRFWGFSRAGSAGSTLAASDVHDDLIRDAPFVHVTGITASLSESAREAVLSVLERTRALLDQTAPSDLMPLAHVESSIERLTVNIPVELWAELDASGPAPDLIGAV